MVADHFIDNEAQELFAKLRIEIGLFRQGPQPGDLTFLAIRIGGRQRDLRLILTDRLRDPKPLGQHVDQRGVDIVDAAAKDRELRIVRRVGVRFIGHILQS